MLSSVVDVAGVVEGVGESTCEEFKVEDDTRRLAPLALAGSPGEGSSCLPFIFSAGRLLLRCSLWNMEGMAGNGQCGVAEQSIEAWSSERQWRGDTMLNRTGYAEDA
jgi:hypothetical protein